MIEIFKNFTHLLLYYTHYCYYYTLHHYKNIVNIITIIELLYNK